MRISEYLAGETESRRKTLGALFATFPADAKVSHIHIAAGETIVRQEEPCRSIYALIEGRARTIIHQQGSAVHAFEDFTAVEFFGEQEVLADMPVFLADVKARTHCRFLIISAADYLRWMNGDSAMLLTRTRSILQTLLRQMAQERSSLYLTGSDRLAKFLVDYCDRHNGANMEVITIAHTHASISEEIGFTVRTVNRAIRSLLDDGMLGLHRGKITVNRKQQRLLQDRLTNVK